MHIKTVAVATIALLLISLPALTYARHDDSRIDTSDLDDEPVEAFPVPVLFGVTIDAVRPDYGDPRGGGTRSHEGQDFIAPLGTPIVSPTEAVVLRTGSGANSGLYVYTRNPGGETFRYMHLDSIADIERGDKLDIGNLIGTVGDTGNAAPGSYHLHFETRDEDNDPTDPYPRLTEEFTTEEKVSFLEDVIEDVDADEDEYAAFLVRTFPEVFREALLKDFELPEEIADILEESPAADRQRLVERLNEVLDLIPTVVQSPIVIGETGTEVALLQTYLLFRSEGPARDALATAGATGYYGNLTAAALLEYKVQNDIGRSNVYDVDTREYMLAK